MRRGLGLLHSRMAGALTLVLVVWCNGARLCSEPGSCLAYKVLLTEEQRILSGYMIALIPTKPKRYRGVSPFLP